jgi:hypothetical protein
VRYINGQGNPTKSKIVSDVIKFVQLCEDRKEGAPSNTKQALTQAEFRKEMELLSAQKNDLTHTVRFRTMGLWQYHLVGRVDTAANAKISAPRVHGVYLHLLQTAVSWSKSVKKERRCPDQILMDAMDDCYCLFNALGLHLESFLADPDPIYQFTAQEDTTKIDPLTGKTKLMRASTRLKNQYRTTLKRAVWSKDEFQELSDGERSELGGAHGEEVEIVNRYIYVKQLYQDAEVAGILCLGFPCKVRL